MLAEVINGGSNYRQLDVTRRLYLCSVPPPRSATPHEDDYSLDAFEAWMEHERRWGLVERVVREDGQVAWVPTATGTAVLGWEA